MTDNKAPVGFFTDHEFRRLNICSRKEVNRHLYRIGCARWKDFDTLLDTEKEQKTLLIT